MRGHIDERSLNAVNSSTQVLFNGSLLSVTRAIVNKTIEMDTTKRIRGGVPEAVALPGMTTGREKETKRSVYGRLPCPLSAYKRLPCPLAAYKRLLCPLSLLLLLLLYFLLILLELYY
jgi:hypothetical protein